MGPVFRMLCGLFVVTLIGAACGSGGNIKPPDPTAKQMVVITIDPETGGVVAVQDTRGSTLMPPVQGQPQVGTLTSQTPVTITVELQPASAQPSAQTSALTGASCRIIIINGRQYCR